MNGWLFTGALLYGALYLQNIIAAGLYYGDRMVVLIAIAALGVSFLSYAANLVGNKSIVATWLVYASWFLGVAAGVALIVAR